MDLRNITYIDKKILEERNYEIGKLSEDIENISEIMSDLAFMVNDQGETIETIVKNVRDSKMATSEAVIALNKTEEYVDTSRKILRNMGIVAGGITIGAIGFIGGPIIGAISIISGCMLGSGIAFITNKF